MSTKERKINKVMNQFLEGYRMLHFNLKYAQPDKPVKTIMLTGATPVVGTTTVAVNLAYFLLWAQESRILLVDCCFQTSMLDRIFEVSLDTGLSDILLKDVDLDIGSTKIVEHGKATLTVIPRGRIPIAPSNLFNQNRIRNFLDDVNYKYDFIIFDTPALLNNSWLLSLPQLMDSVLIVTKSGLTSKRMVYKTKMLLSKAQSKSIGLVLNCVE